MKTDARSLLNLKRKRQQRKWGGTLQVTDARQVLKMKYAQKKKHIGPMNRASVNVVKNQLQQNFNQKRNNYGRLNQNNFNKFTQSNFSRNPGFRKTNSPGQNSRPQFNKGRQGFVQKLNRNPIQANRNRPQGASSGFLQTVQNRGQLRKKVVFSPDKLVRSDRNGIIITTKTSTFQPNRTVIEGDDELEQMTLDDLPGMENLPHGLISTRKPPLWESASTSKRPSVVSRLHLSDDTMVADTVASGVAEGEHARVVISNLMPTVSEDDIIELFGNLGPLTHAQLTAPGKAVIEYASARDALLAIEKYNGILLDGQAMHCYLMPSYGRRSSVTSRLGEKAFPTSAATSVHQSKPSMFAAVSPSYFPTHQPSRDVKFTVKLPKQ